MVRDLKSERSDQDLFYKFSTQGICYQSKTNSDKLRKYLEFEAMSDILNSYWVLVKLVPVTNMQINELFCLGLSRNTRGFWQQYFL